MVCFLEGGLDMTETWEKINQLVNDYRFDQCVLDEYDNEREARIDFLKWYNNYKER